MPQATLFRLSPTNTSPRVCHHYEADTAISVKTAEPSCMLAQKSLKVYSLSTSESSYKSFKTQYRCPFLQPASLPPLLRQNPVPLLSFPVKVLPLTAPAGPSGAGGALSPSAFPSWFPRDTGFLWTRSHYAAEASLKLVTQPASASRALAFMCGQLRQSLELATPPSSGKPFSPLLAPRAVLEAQCCSWGMLGCRAQDAGSIPWIGWAVFRRLSGAARV